MPQKRVKTIYDTFLDVINADDEAEFKRMFDEEEFNIHELAKAIIQGTKPISAKYLKFAHDLDPDNKYWRDARILKSFHDYEENDPNSLALRYLLQWKEEASVYTNLLALVIDDDEHEFRRMYHEERFNTMELVKTIVRSTVPINVKYLEIMHELEPNAECWKNQYAVLCFAGYQQNDVGSRAIQRIVEWRDDAKSTKRLRDFAKEEFDYDEKNRVIIWRR